MVQGVDVWLNTPRRLQEASGTSGMKAAANGVLNMSIPDGWWEEGYSTEAGWAIGRGEIYDDLDHQDEVESQVIYELLEKEIVPLFYTRSGDGLPRGWTAKMKAAITRLAPVFNTDRMLMEYTDKYYLPAGSHYLAMQSDGAAGQGLAAWKARVRENWAHVRVKNVEADTLPEVCVSAEFEVRARVHLGSLLPDDALVQLYSGRVNQKGEIEDGQVAPCR
jgi:starch phosphorylase